MSDPSPGLKIAVLAFLASSMIFTASPAASASASDRFDVGVIAESSPSPAEANEIEAMGVVELHEQAFIEVDCDLFVEATTQAYRERMGLADCSAFEEQARGRADVVDSIELTLASVNGMGPRRIGVEVRADFRGYIDEDGKPVDSPVAVEWDYRYHLARIDGAWKIEQVHDVTGGRTPNLPTVEDESAAAGTMNNWKYAFTSGDCDKLNDSTTAGFRQANGWPDCAAFTQTLAEREETCPAAYIYQEDMRFHTNVDPHSGEIIVDVVISCAYGDPDNPDYEYGFPYRYHLVDEDGVWRIAEAEDGASAEDEPSNANERAAVDAIRAYNKAWIDIDCDAYMSKTTEGLRSNLDLVDCESFVPAAEDFSRFVTNFVLIPTDIERPSVEDMEIKSHETWQEPIDADGQRLVRPYEVDEYYVYDLVLIDGEWLIADLYLLL